MTAERPRILDELRYSKPDVFWALASCKSISHFADPDGTTFLRQVDRMFQQGEITEIRRLILFDEDSELDQRIVKIFLLLHEQSNYKYKVISSDYLNAIYRNFGDKTLMKDFGIWGSSFVWETPEENIMTLRGLICKKLERIRLYRQLYDELWEAARVHKINQPELIELVRGHSIDQLQDILRPPGNTEKNNFG
jgi:hypothetical protein